MVGLAHIRRNTVFFSNGSMTCIYKSDCRVLCDYSAKLALFSQVGEKARETRMEKFQH